MIKVGIKILPRKEILDTQGRAVEKVLKQKINENLSCRVGKFIEMNIEAKSPDEAKAKIRDMAEYVLYNPLLETYEIEIYG